MRLVFILGSHRTGTKSWARFFARYYSEVHSFHQFPSLRWVNVFSNLFLAGKVNEKVLRFVLRKTLIKHINKHSDRPVYILSNGFAFLAASLMKTIYPDVRIIHTVRDPRTYIVSYMNFIDDRWQSKVANRMIPYWHFPGSRTDAFSRSEWNKLSTFEKYTWYWKFKNEWIEQHYTANSSGFLQCRLEDLGDDAKRHSLIRDVTQFIGLSELPESAEFFNKKINASSGERLSSWENWTPEQAAKLDAIAGPLMKSYGYGNETEWQALVNRGRTEIMAM